MTTTNIYSPTRDVGNGVTTAFTVTFKVDDETDLDVFLVDTLADTNKVLQTLTTDYTVAINTTSEGATITFVTAPPSTKDVIIERTEDYTQTTDIPDVATIQESVLEGSFDKNTRLIQQLLEIIGRTVNYTVEQDSAITGPSFDYALPSPPATGTRALFLSQSSIVLSNTDLSDIDASVTAAAASAAAAAVSETNAATSETNAATSETNAATSETNAATSETNAAASAAAAAGAFNINDVSWICTSSTQVVITNGSRFVGVDSGTQFTFTSSRTFDITGTAGDLGALNTGTEAVSTWYYMIGLGDTTAVTAPHVIGVTEANYASFTTADLTGNYAVYDDFKRIGAIRNDGSSDFFEGQYSENKFYIDLIDTARKNTASTSFVDLDFSTFAPPISRAVELVVTHGTTTGDAAIRIKGLNGGGAVPTATLTAATASGTINTLFNSSQIIEAKVSAGTVQVQLISYLDDLSDEGQ